MRFIFTSAGSFGDIAPLLVLAVELRQRGCDVRWVVNPFHQASLKKWGFDSIPAGEAATVERTIRDPRLSSPLRSFAALREAGEKEAEPFLDVLMETVGNDDVLVYRSLVSSARIVEEKKGIPGVAVYVAPTELTSEEDRACIGGHLSDAVSRSAPGWLYTKATRLIESRVIDRMMWKFLNPLRRKVGLDERHGSYRDWMFGARLPLALYPDWYGRLGARMPAQMRQTGFPYLQSEQVMPLDPALGEFLDAGEPPAAITQGSAIRPSEKLVEQLISACNDFSTRTLLLSFDHEGPPKIEGNHCITSPVAMSQVLPRCRALVHRGGAGAVAEGLRFGIPQLIVAQTMDHPDHGARVTRLGAGRWAYDPTATSWQIRRELDRVLHDSEIRRGAEAAAARCDAEGWRRESADLIEKLAKARD
ncbi:glycosyltransferase [Haloferula sp. A504]|uniref:glycosyltransferase n=1 Tax=Haloferula sp. A504 TaxID=3373601 RepID=UPI0031C10803|nr:glycosyltransferase [Verrucomicrobiaceae bacterium E54]